MTESEELKNNIIYDLIVVNNPQDSYNWKEM